ncbi:hypothetical protein MES4922_100032 [Mesorhizobium ventifaucium]|uniref:Uncharacterized protein n=1 Tax=Mesorhizobium ventifaucium TaxID=666020 RepID=A0ABM9DD28_9HYPH|nr:hypothetical protein MES4922_100032 [Mesorhizobium ventifaucium]
MIPSLAGVRRICQRRKLTDVGWRNKESDFKNETLSESNSQNYSESRQPAEERPPHRAVGQCNPRDISGGTIRAHGTFVGCCRARRRQFNHDASAGSSDRTATPGRGSVA